MQPKAKKKEGPKMGRTSYMFFTMEQHKSAEISNLSLGEASTAISKRYRTAARMRLERAAQHVTTYSRVPHPVACRWKEIPAEEKATYVDMAQVDQMRYQRELTEAEHGVLEPRPKQPKKAAEAPEVRPKI